MNSNGGKRCEVEDAGLYKILRGECKHLSCNFTVHIMFYIQATMSQWCSPRAGRPCV